MGEDPVTDPAGSGAEELGALPGGHHHLTRQQIHESQRERLLAAVAKVVATRGYRNSTITEIGKAASVSTRDFYHHFKTKEECFLAAFDAIEDHLTQLITEAAGREPDWAHQVVAALRTALEFFASEPELARLCLVEAVSATPAIALRFREAVHSCIPPLARGRAELADPHSLLPETENAVIGGAISLATRTIIAGDISSLPKLLPDIAEFTLGPYLGADRTAATTAGSHPG